MKKYLTLLFLVCIFGSCKKTEVIKKSFPLTGVVDDFYVFQHEIKQNDDKLYVVNFWAAWCVPCVEELPDFVKLYNEYKKDIDFEMVLVSLDRASDLETKVEPFVQKHNITPPVFILSDVKRMNEWIPAINTHWSGAIPATAIYKNGKQLFFKEGIMSYEELKKVINK